MPENVKADAPLAVRRKWRVVDETGVERGLWVERWEGRAEYDEAWALDCAAKFHPGLEVQVQTITTSDWTRVLPPALGQEQADA